jgi:hypothetical protein
MPRRSGRARLTHPALQATNSLRENVTYPPTEDLFAGVAIRSCCVEMGSGLGVPGIFPSSGLMARRPLPSAGSLGSVPPRPR